MSKIFEGTVVSVKMRQTAVVEVTRKKPHSVYKKLLKRSKRYKVETGNFKVEKGNKVKITEVRPLSKDKHFMIMEVIK